MAGRFQMFTDAFLRLVRKSAIALVLLVLPLAAQTGLGVVRGTVHDASQAVVPNAKITLTDTDTGIARNGESNSAGIYSFEALPIGPYRLMVEATGFKRWEATLTVLAG